MLDDVTTNPTPNESRDPAEPRKHSLAARLLTAKLFSGLGSNLFLLGMPFDTAALIKDPNLGFFQRLRLGFSGKGFAVLSEKLSEIGQTESYFARIGPMLKLAKYTTILGAIGTVGGALLGWVRGGLIENWKDIFAHPIRSTLIVLGLKSPPEPEAKKPVTEAELSPNQPPQREWGKAMRERADAAAIAEPQRG